jgi:3-polyprenyl-4-hydroxybenzoate decarboxylase
MLHNRMQELKVFKKVKAKLEVGRLLEVLLKEKNKKILHFKQIKEKNKEMLAETIDNFQIVDGVSLWEVNRKLKRLTKRGITKQELDSRKIIIPLSMKKTNIPATLQEKNRIEKSIDESEGIELLRLHYFYNYKPIYMEKKMFGEVSRWIEIHLA